MRTNVPEGDVKKLSRALPHCDIITQYAKLEPRKPPQKSTKSMFEQKLERRERSTRKSWAPRELGESKVPGNIILTILAKV